MNSELNPLKNEALAVIKYKKGDEGVKIIYSTHESRSEDAAILLASGAIFSSAAVAFWADMHTW